MVRREKFANGTPPPKPERTFADKLRTLKEVSKGIAPESRLRLLDYFIQEALEKNQITKDQASGIYEQLQQDKDKIRDQIDAYDRVNFSEGSKDEQRKIADDEYYASLQKIIERDPAAKKFFNPDDITYPAMDRSGEYNYRGVQVQTDDLDFFKRYAKRRGLDQILSPESTFERKIEKGQFPIGLYTEPVQTGSEPGDLDKISTMLHEARHRVLMNPEFSKIIDQYGLDEEIFVRYLDKEFFPELEQELTPPTYRKISKEDQKYFDKAYGMAVKDYKKKFKRDELKEKFVAKVKSFFADGGRAELQGGTDPKTGQGFQPNNPGNPESLRELNISRKAGQDSRVTRFKELVVGGNTPNEAKKTVIEEFKLDRNPKAGTPAWMTRGKTELIEEGFDYQSSPRGPKDEGGVEKAAKKRKQVIGEGRKFEERVKRKKQITGLGRDYELAHTANIFQAKKLGIDYPVDALAIQTRDVNQVIAEGLNDELKPLYSKQLKLVNKMKRKNTPSLQKQLDKINFEISELVASGGKQGKKAANVLKPIIVDPKTLQGNILDLGFDTSTELMTVPGATTKGAKPGTDADLMARLNIGKALTKGAKITGKVIKPVGYAFGTNAVRNAVKQAAKQGITLSIVDKAMAFESGDPETAFDNWKRRNVPGYSEQQNAITLAKLDDDFEEIGKSTFGKYNDQIKNLKLPKD